LEVLEGALEIYWNKPRTARTLKYVTANYSIFDFLLGLGECFTERLEFHQYTLSDVYERILTYVKKSYPDDPILQELIEVDYCVAHKVRPRPLLLAEIEAFEKASLIDQLGVRFAHSDKRKLRYLALPLSFDLELFEQENRIELGEFKLLIRYDGTSRPESICVSGQLELV
jgi:anaerobic magnesium-protoporphyrin IX monomethyl ester cyclase